MKDYLVKALAYQDQVRAYSVTTTETIGEAQRRHDTWATASVALGRSMTVSVMLGAMLKGEEKLSTKIDGGGPIGTIIVDANAKGEVRGYVKHPQTHVDLNDLGELDVAKAVGTNGMLSVSKDIGLQQSFIGHVPLVSGELGEDFTSYIVNSEQIPSSVGVGVLVNSDNTIQSAGGFIIQLMPGTNVEMISFIEDRLKVIPNISSILRQGMTPEQILDQVLGDGNVRVLEKMPIQFQCQCSKEKLSNAIVSLGTDEIQDMIHTDGQAEAQCHFCNEGYFFTKEDLELLLEAAIQ
jgi:molecular chaperone Hsp33